MRSFVAGFSFMALAVGFAAPGNAQRLAARVPLAPERVTLLTDGIGDPFSTGVQLVNELAGRLGQQGLRVLPIAGEGATANLRDLLQLKGVDLAIINSDVLAYLDITGEFSDARRRIRYVTQLADQTVYVLARKDVPSVEGLRGRRVVGLAPVGGTAITARTLFKLLDIEVDLQSLTLERLAKDPAPADIDGLVLLSSDVARLGLAADALRDFKLLPIVAIPALQAVYKPVRIATTELDGIARPSGTIDGVALSTVLAVFNWTPQQSRYASVAAFIRALFQALPTLRTTPTASLWRQVDVNAAIPGWQRYPFADPTKLLSPPQLASLAAIEKPAPPVMTIAQADRSPPQVAKPLSILVINRAPLADERAPDGGLIPALLSTALAVGGQKSGLRTSISWSKSDPVSLQLLTNEVAVDLLLPWDLPDCERPNDLTQAQAMLCDRAMFSDPILQVVIGLFFIAGGDFKFDTDASIHGRTICLSADRDLAELAAPGRNWLAEKRITLIRQPTLLDCVGTVQRREADAFVATDIEGWHLLQQFGIGQLFAMTERPLGTRTIHAAVWKGNAQASETLEKVNRAIRQIKDSGVHANLVRQRLMPIWDNRINVR